MVGFEVPGDNLRADQTGRVTPHMQEQVPRRDVLGCNRKTQKNVATEPAKEPYSIHIVNRPLIKLKTSQANL